MVPTTTDDEQVRKLYVGRLNKKTVDDSDLLEYFQTYGTVVDARVLRFPGGESRGFGFVLFEDATSVDAVMSDKKAGVLFELKVCELSLQL